MTWDQYFSALAQVCAKKSKDPSTQVGAVVTDQFHQIVGTGYNGFPRGVKDSDFPWARTGPLTGTKYPYVVHAEVNAILQARSEAGLTLYTTMFPCSNCAKIIVQAGVRKVVYQYLSQRQPDDYQAARKMLRVAQITCYQQPDPLLVTLHEG